MLEMVALPVEGVGISAIEGRAPKKRALRVY
jgi:hypothetical protein